MTKLFKASVSAGGLTVTAHSGDRCVLLAFNLDDGQTNNLAGFAISRTPQGQPTVWLGNRLSFDGPHTDPAASPQGKFFDSDVAPFQKFWWVDFPPENTFGDYVYEVTVMQFKDDNSTDLTADQKVSLTVDVGPFVNGNIEVAFTRGYLSSQAYADLFQNKPYAPARGPWNFDSAPYLPQWEWLGAHARQAIIDFLNECYLDPNAEIDALVYDFNEPDIIRALTILGPRLRLISDDSKTHADSTAAGQAYAAVAQATGEGKTLRGHFSRFQHNKVFIKKVNGVAQKVLTGSTNFSITGIYVNANHVLVFNDPTIAAQYETAFQEAFTDSVKTTPFTKATISQQEFTFNDPGNPQVIISYAPHKTPTFSLDRLLKAINGAQSSVIFAVMELTGSQGGVVKALSALHNDKNVFSYGISDSVSPTDNTIDGTTVYTPSSIGGELVYAKENPEHFPPPFSDELEVTGLGHIIHHKFVVVDFNGQAPVVFCGSSNLAEGGEEANGDNLIAIYDPAIATAFAIEGIRLVDHYAFAAALKRAAAPAGQTGTPQPLSLQANAAKWWAPYYVDGDIRYTERKLFSS